MNIHELELIDHLTHKELRTIAKDLNTIGSLSEEKILSVLKQHSQASSNDILKYLIENKYLEKTDSFESNENNWEATLELRAIAGASLNKRKKSDKAWEEVAKVLARTVALSDDLEWNIERPSKLFLFGSMLNPTKKDYGDADLSLVCNRQEDFFVLKERQNNWIENNKDFISNQYYSFFGFSEWSQLLKDMCNSSSFPSIHFERDITSLAEQPKNKDNFPVFTLWENKIFNTKSEDTEEILDLSQKWKHKNPESFVEIENRLNTALNKLGILNYTDKYFENSCKEYVKKEMAEELMKKLQDGKEGSDKLIIKKIVRFGGLGFEAIGKVCAKLPNFVELAKTSDIINILPLLEKNLKANNKNKLKSN